MGRSGRDAVTAHLSDVKTKVKADVVILNGENAASGIGITEKIVKQFYKDGVDVITTGNHVWDQREIIPYIDRDPKLLRPINFPDGTPGKGSYIHALSDGRKILVANAMGRLFMDTLDDPFSAINELVETNPMKLRVQAIFVDFHAEASSEKMSFAHFLDGRVSAVVGTHTHIPTADAQILPGGTALQSDAGMTGDYNSVIGVEKETPIQRFTRKMPTDRLSPADGEATLCGTFVETDDKTGLATRIEPVRVGPRLHNHIPVV